MTVPPAAAPAPAVRLGITVAVALACAAAFTWPSLLSVSSGAGVRGFDGDGMIWMGSHVARHPPWEWLHTTASGWPDGEDLHGNDGWLWLLLAAVLPAAATPAGLHLLAWLGSAATFLAAERLAASGYGARWPWSMAAGVVFAFDSVAAGSLGEGRMYHLALWPLPLFFLAWRRLLDGARNGLAVGLAWSLCLGTTVYAAVLAALAAAFLAAWEPGVRRHLRPIAVAVLAALPGAVAFAWVFSRSARLDDWLPEEVPTLLNAATPAGLLGWSPGLALASGFPHCALGFGALALALASTRLLPRRTWAPLVSGAAVALLLSLGFKTNLTVFDPPAWTTPLGWLAELVPSIRFFRFTVRFLLLTHLALGVLAALALSVAAGRFLRGALAAALLVDAFFWTTPVWAPRSGYPTDRDIHQDLPPDAAILDLLPVARTRLDYDLTVVARRICADQVKHGRPVAEWCLAPVSDASPAAVLRRDLTGLLLEGRLDDARSILADHAVNVVVLHEDLYPPSDAHRLAASLAALASTSRSGWSGREWLHTYELAPP